MRVATAVVIGLVLLLGTQACMNAPKQPKIVTLDRDFWTKVRHRDLYNEPLWPTVLGLVHWEQGRETYGQAGLRAAAGMPRGLRCYFFIMSLDGKWGNGGMQAVVLSDDPESSWKLVEGAAEALRFHGSVKKAQVLDELLSVARIVQPKLWAALNRDAPESELRELWSQIDVFDERYDKADPKVDVYARIVKHAHKHPEEYTPNASAGTSATSSADSNRFHSPTAGFAVRKPASWRFASLEQVAANRAVARLKDKELEQQIRQKANAPLVVIQKHREPYDDLNPSAQVMVRPLGQWEGRTALELMRLVVPTLQRAMADFAFVEQVREATVGGMPAAFMKAKYTVTNREGREFKTLSRMWIIPRGSFMFMVSMSGPQEGLDVSEGDFSAILDSIKIEE